LNRFFYFYSRQDSSTSLFSPTFLTSSRNQIKKSMSDRSGKSPESLSPTHLLSTSPKSPNLTTSSSRTLSTSDNSTPNESSNKKSSFHLFDSILQRSVTKPLTINTSTHHDTTHQKKISTPSSSSSSSSLVANNQLPEQARCLHSYSAIKEDEICVHKGEMVQIVAANQDNRWFVHRDANRTSPAAEGWIPGSVLGLRNPNSSIHHKLSPSPPPSSSSSSSLHQQPTSSLSANSLHRSSTTSSTHHPTITYESTLPPKPQSSTCDKV
jgi:hypothetical protein